ncbi:MAG: penicillin-binding protein 2 [Ferrovum sp.]|nr:penicillin-binding protein 2 [Ferrovum sp.]NDU86980.1 penicillin-binding protein 2 [Ferrovum sp.]
MKPVARKKLALRLERWRSLLVQGVLLAGFAAMTARAAWLQGLNSGFLQQKGEERYSRVLSIPASRGIIRDRNGEPLAISIPAESLWANREDIELTPGQRQVLARSLNETLPDMEHRLHGESGMVYLKRQLPPEEAQRVMDLKIPGVFVQHGFHRAYPKANEMAHLVGFTDADDKGQEGVELAFQNSLEGVPGARRVIRDRAGHVIEDVENIRLPRQGQDLSLSVDARIQHLAARELRQAVESSHAKAGAAVVLDSRTGEILALVNSPDYDPNQRGGLSGAELRNRAITDTYEPGSTIKPFTIAAALEAGKVQPDTVISTHGGVLSIGNHLIHDDHVAESYTVSEVIKHSSNVGAARIALSLPPVQLWDMFTDVGFGQKPKLGFPGESGGRLRPYQNWKPIEQATMAFGNGMTVSLLQMARAYTVFANDGILRPLSLIRTTTPAKGRQVISARTAHQVLTMLETVVSAEGTAPQARVPGYRVAGKTGTAHKVVKGHYVNKYVASFIGLAPVTAPRIIVAIMVDEPEGSRYYGGQIAAPVFSALTGEVLQLLEVPPDAPDTVASSHAPNAEHHT